MLVSTLKRLYSAGVLSKWSVASFIERLFDAGPECLGAA